VTTAPQLAEGEDIIHHHVPNLGVFKRTALLLLAITLVPTLVIAVAVPDTFWAAVPMFVTCLLLMQERYNLGKHAAWITNQRVLFQGDEALALNDITSVEPKGNGVLLRHDAAAKSTKLNYAKDRSALAQTILTAQKETA